MTDILPDGGTDVGRACGRDGLPNGGDYLRGVVSDATAAHTTSDCDRHHQCSSDTHSSGTSKQGAKVVLRQTSRVSLSMVPVRLSVPIDRYSSRSVIDKLKATRRSRRATSASTSARSIAYSSSDSAL